MATTVQQWSVDDVSTFLERLQLNNLVPEFKSNAVNGKDLIALTDEELAEELKCTKLQIKKIRSELETLAPGSTPVATLKPVAPASKKASSDSLTTPTTPPAAAAKPTANAEIDPKDVARYQELRGEISQLEDERVEEFAKAAQDRVQHANALRTHAQQAVRKADDDLAVAEKEVRDLDDWYLGKNVIGEKKRTEKKDEKLSVAAKARTVAKEAHERAEKAKEELSIAQNASRNFNGKVARLGAARAELATLMERVFSAPEWATDPTLSSLRAVLGELNGKAVEASRHAGVYANSRELLVSARRKIDEAMGMMQRTQSISAIQLGRDIGPGFRRQPGSLMGNMAEMAMIERANEFIKSAATDFAAARQRLPALPYQNDVVLDDARRGVFVSMLAPGFIGGMAEMAAIRKSMETVKEMQAGVQQCLDWVAANLVQFNNNVSSLQGQVASKKAEIVAYENAQLKTVAEKK